MLRIFILFTVFNSLQAFSSTISEDVVRTDMLQSALDQRVEYKQALLSAILEASVERFGPYRIEYQGEPFARNRALQLMQAGEQINLYVAPADPDWEEKTVPIRIPIRRGLLNYRLLLTTQQHLQALGEVNTIEELKRFKVGLRAQWTTTKVMEAMGFDIVKGGGYDSIFKMLSYNRFHYIPRGINEVHSELDMRREELPTLAIENRIALYLPMPVYFYVSPAAPKLSRRIEYGFEKLIRNGEFERLFLEYFGDKIKRAQLNKRHIIALGNPLLSEQTPFGRTELWFNPIEN